MTDPEGGPELAEAAATFDGVRPVLFGIAYRMLGAVADAEDVVQEAWIRWQRTDRSVVRDPRAFLATTATRLALTAATSARARRETYPGPWLPEPVDLSADPALGAERGEAVELAVLLLLERLTPNERAVYVLREAFDYPYRRIAEVLEVSEANARQIARRARAHVTEERPAPVGREEHGRLLRAFLAAARAGDLSRLEGLLTEGAVSYSDGGGAVGSARVPVFGRSRVARFLAGVSTRFGQDLTVRFVESNNRDAALLVRGGEAIALCTVDASPAGVERVFMVVNPAKLTRFHPGPGPAQAPYRSRR